MAAASGGESGGRQLVVMAVGGMREIGSAEERSGARCHGGEKQMRRRRE